MFLKAIRSSLTVLFALFNFAILQRLRNSQNQIAHEIFMIYRTFGMPIAAIISSARCQNACLKWRCHYVLLFGHFNFKVFTSTKYIGLWEKCCGGFIWHSTEKITSGRSVKCTYTKTYNYSAPNISLNWHISPQPYS